MSRMTEEIGRVLGGRYRIIAPIGRGASAQVFLADDVRLRRRVAVKMLHAALADDADFLKRFQAEAQAAAALNHPHVMAVYDWGQDPEDEIPYLVLEYLGGGSLRAMLDQGTRLTLSQALLVGLEATRALEYAHQRGFVHRDIKPANLVFGDEGRLRIADFGLARALAEAAWTEPQGAVLGTARYASPEVAQGKALTGKADVYSLALVLVEAVTGQVPFAADTTLGTLMGRVGKPLVVPDELGPLRSAIERAGRPEPEDRLDAHRFAVALMAAAEELAKPEPFPLAGAIAVAPGAIDIDPTELGLPVAPVAGPTVAGSAADIDVDGEADDSAESHDFDVPAFVTAGAPPVAPPDEDATTIEEVDDLDVPDFMVGPSPAWPPAPAVAPADEGDDDGGHDDTTVIDLTDAALAALAIDHAPAVPYDDAELALADEDDEPDAGPRRPRRWPRRTFLLVLLGTAALVAALLVSNLTRTPEHDVPRVVGVDLAVARARMATFGWTIKERHTRQDGTTAGEVLAVSPAPGTSLAEDKRVTLLVSDGNTIAPVPSGLAGHSRAEATALVRARGFVVAYDDQFSEDAKADTVISLGAGTHPRMVKGGTVTLVVSKGPKPRTIPGGLAGRTEGDVKAALAGLQLEVHVTRRYDDTVKEGVVIDTTPGSGATAARGATVEVLVSRGPEPVKVPDVSTVSTPQDAAQLLRAAGLVPGNVSGPIEGTPSRTSPAAGSLVPPGTTVDIVLKVGKGKKG